jgi:hypothetical protein
MHPTTDTTPQAQPHIKDLRSLMVDQLRALRSAEPGEDLEAEIKRSKAVSELSQTIINSAKVEVDYLVATEQLSAPFLEVPPDEGVAHLGHTATGTVTQVGNRTVHKLRG